MYLCYDFVFNHINRELGGQERVALLNRLSFLLSTQQVIR